MELDILAAYDTENPDCGDQPGTDLIQLLRCASRERCALCRWMES